MPQPRTVFPHHRQDRRELDGDLEHLALLVVEAEQLPGEDQVPGTGDRQKFGQALDDAEDQGVQQQGGVGHG